MNRQINHRHIRSLIITCLIFFSTVVLLHCGGGGDGSTNITPNGEIEVPTGVTASDGSAFNQVDITWNSVSNAVSYNVYRADSEAGAYVQLGNAAGISFIDSSAAIDVFYWYKVSAVDSSSNESDLSVADKGWATGGDVECGNGSCEDSETVDSCPRDCLLESIEIMKAWTAHGSFSPDDSQIVVDRPNLDLFYDLYTIDLDGNILKSLTKDNPIVNQRGNSWPAWHPSGDYIVFQSEEESHWKMDDISLSDPGLGFFHNLYAIDMDGKQIWKLTDIPIKQDALDGIPIYACVNPTFNKDGSKLMWAERYAGGGDHSWGYWRIKMADFNIGPDGPELQNVETVLDPPDLCGSSDCQYANGMAFIDEITILVTGDLDGQHVYGMDLYLYDLASQRRTNLLNTPEFWEEGASFANGRIVYMTNIDSEYVIDFDDPDWQTQPRTREYWVMDVDGSSKRRLTYFNSPSSPEYQDLSQGRRTIVAKCNFSHDGSMMVGVVGFDNGSGDTVKMSLNLGLFDFLE